MPRLLAVIGILAMVLTGVAALSSSATAAQVATSTSVSGATSQNLSDNPVLARGKDGFRILQGAKRLKRVHIKRHQGARFAVRTRATVDGGATARTATTDVRIALPRVSVKPGDRMYFGADVEAPSGTSAHISVSWFDASGNFLTWSGGSLVAMSPTQWRTISAELTVPQNAATGETVVNVLNVGKDRRISITNHVVKVLSTATTPSTTSPSPTSSTTPSSPAPSTTSPSPTTSTTSSSPTSSPTPSSSTPLDNSHPQPAIIDYGDGTNSGPYAKQGALVVSGRDNFNATTMKNVSAAGGTVLVYLDALIDNSYGRYATMLIKDSECGPAVPRWPGNYQANSWGYLNDFRPGSVLQGKLECVLEKIVAENPHIGGFFADDLGSRSWFPGFSWDSFGSQNQQDYRAGAIALSKTFRKVADRHGLIFMVNGTWGGGSLATSGGGYPDASQSGNALADGTLAEHHSPDTYWAKSYPCASQWADQSAVTKGMAFNFAVTTSDADRDAFAKSGCYAFAANQQYYNDPASVWGSFSPTGLPSKVAY